MPGILYNMPKSLAWDNGLLLPGAKLTFTQTGTTTPQNVYQDAALSTAHSNPVEADAEGVFAPIYLDSSLPDYRVRYTTAADVLVYQVDDVPAGVESAINMTLEDGAPFLELTESDAAANNQNWRLIASGEQLLLQVGNDAKSAYVNLLEIDRTLNVVDLVNIVSTSLTLNGDPLFASGSFTGALTGFASDLTPTVQWRRSVNTVWLTVNAGSTGTSTTTAMTLGTLPAAIRPATALTVIVRLTDNSANVVGVASIATSGVITFGNGIAGGAFTGSGTKGLPGGWSMSFDLQ